MPPMQSFIELVFLVISRSDIFKLIVENYNKMPSFKMSTKNNIFHFNFFAYSFLKVHLHHTLKIKSHKEVTK